jgi:hypothetical protein
MRLGRGSNNYATFVSPDFLRRLFIGFDAVAIYPGVSDGPDAFAVFQDTNIFRRQASADEAPPPNGRQQPGPVMEPRAPSA